jgi:hypothetical protein
MTPTQDFSLQQHLVLVLYSSSFSAELYSSDEMGKGEKRKKQLVVVGRTIPLEESETNIKEGHEERSGRGGQYVLLL